MVIPRRGHAIGREIYDVAPRWVVAYIGKTINDARKVDGVWYSDQNGKILRLNLQHAVQTLCTCDNGANNRASCEAAERELTGSARVQTSSTP